MTFSSGGLRLDEGDTLVVYTWKSGRKVPVSYEAVWYDVSRSAKNDGRRITYHHQSVRV